MERRNLISGLVARNSRLPTNADCYLNGIEAGWLYKYIHAKLLGKFSNKDLIAWLVRLATKLLSHSLA